MRRSLPSLQRLRALEAVLRLGGFSAAAEELLLTQSAVSNQIKRLEDETGVLLVERIGKRVKPTPEGGILLAAAGRMTAELAAALMRIADMQGEVSGRFVIGAGGVASTYHLPPLLARFAGEHPKAEVDLRTGNAGVLAHGLIDGTIDIIVATGIAADARLTREPFADDRLICVVPPGDETTLQAVGASDLAGRRLVLFEKGGQVREAVDAWLDAGLAVRTSAVAAGTSASMPPRILEVGLSEAQKSFVIAGFGWSIVSEIAVAREVQQGLMRALPLKPPLSRPLAMAWRRDRVMNPAIRAMREILRDGRKN